MEMYSAARTHFLGLMDGLLFSLEWDIGDIGLKWSFQAIQWMLNGTMMPLVGNLET